MTTILALLLAMAGFAALALSLHRHHQAVFGAPPPRPRAVALRVVGWALLALSLAACVAGEGWAVGSVLWCGVLTAAALAVVLLMALRPVARRSRNH